MGKTMSKSDDERFHSGVEKYAAYLKSAEGRLRSDLAFANLEEFLPRSKESLHTLDLGCGTGELAVRLARLGCRVTLLDISSTMLDFAERAAREAGVADRIVLENGDASELVDLFNAGQFDLVLCHNVLEYVKDPRAVLCGAARMLRDSASMISLLVRNQAGDVLKSAIKDGDLTAAEQNLTAEWGHESLYGGDVRLFTTESLTRMGAAASLTVTAERGVRTISDYLPLRISRDDEYERIFQLERRLGRQPEFAAVARYTHCLAHRTAPLSKDVV